MVSISATSAIVSWNSESVSVDMYFVMWKRNTSVGCPDIDEGNLTLSGTDTSLTIMDLEEDSSYSIFMMTDNAIRGNVTVVTLEAGMLD